MASIGQGDNSFDILGSTKLNTQDGKNPTPLSSNDTKTPSSAEAGGQGSGGSKGEEYRRECQNAHDEMEARLKDEEQDGRSRGWNE